MKKFFYSLFLNIFVINSVAFLFNGFSLPKDFIYWWILMIAFSVAVILHKPFLKFFTIKVNFLTFWLSAALLLFGVMVGLTVIMPDFYVTASSIKGTDLGVVTIQGFTMSKYIVMLSISFLSCLFIAFLDFLGKGGSD